MERRSTRSSRPGQKHERSCVWGLFKDAIESCQDQTCGKLISNGRPSSNQIIDYPRKIDRLTSFDEECRRFQIQNESDLKRVKADEYILSKTYKTVYHVINQHHRDQIDPELVGLLLKAHNRSKEKRRNEHHSTSLYSNDTANVYRQLRPTSSKISPDGVNLAAILRTVCVHSRQEENIHTRAKAFADQMFIQRKLISKGVIYARSNPSSNAFGISDSAKDLFGGLFSDTRFLLPCPPKNSKYPRIEKETLKSFLDRKELEGVDSSGSSETSGNVFATRNRKMVKNSWLKSAKTGSVEHHLDRTAILKATPRKSRKQPENVNCHCSSSLQDHKKGRKFSETKPKPSSFKEMKKKMKHAFGGSRKELSKFPNIGSKTILDFPNGGEQPFDVILEAKKQLSSRLENMEAVESMACKKPFKTLAQILSSPERDCRPVEQTTSSPYNGSSILEMAKENDGACPSRLNSRAKSRDFVYKNYGLEIMDRKTGGLKIDNMQSVLISHPHTLEDSVTVTEVSTSSMDDLPLAPSSIVKHQGEHESPVSVLDPFFAKDANSPPSATPQIGKFSEHHFKPCRLDFEKCSVDSSHHDPPNSCAVERDDLSLYVRSVLETSCLNWDRLSEIAYPHEEILDLFVFDEVGFSPASRHSDPKLLFDHMNEILLEIYRFHFCSPWPKTTTKPKPLAELVVDEVMKGTKFYSKGTEGRMLDHLVSKDLARSGSWIDLRYDNYEIANEMLEECVEDCLIDVLLELYTWSVCS